MNFQVLIHSKRYRILHLVKYRGNFYAQLHRRHCSAPNHQQGINKPLGTLSHRIYDRQCSCIPKPQSISLSFVNKKNKAWLDASILPPLKLYVYVLTSGLSIHQPLWLHPDSSHHSSQRCWNTHLVDVVGLFLLGGPNGGMKKGQQKQNNTSLEFSQSTFKIWGISCSRNIDRNSKSG